MSKIDENSEYYALATDTDGNAAPLKVDPTTGSLLIDITYEDPSITLNAGKIDENKEGVALALDDSGQIKPLLTNASGLLLVDILFE